MSLRATHRVIEKLGLEVIFALRSSSFLEEAGWPATYRTGEATGRYGEPIPWWTYSAIDFIEPRLQRAMNVFEYGSGNSTLWLAERVNRIVAVEHDDLWYQTMRAQVPASVEIVHRPLGTDYIVECKRHGVFFDLVIIDGRLRVECARVASEVLSERGVIVWDNAERQEYAEGLELLMETGYRRIDFHSMGPVNAYGWTTSIFYRENNCFDI